MLGARPGRFVARYVVALLVLALCVTAATSAPDGATTPEPFSHRDWREVLERFVDQDGRVDYRGLAGDRAALDRYLVSLRTAGPASTPERFPGPDHALAYYLNAYNALVFEGVLSRGQDLDTVWGWTGTGIGFFMWMRVALDGKTLSLKELEDDLIRDGFGDPRIHAALNCASVGCPRLPREPFDGARLDDQLDRAMREFVNDPRHFRIDREGRTVTVNKIFDWFEKDFVRFERKQPGSDGSLIDYLNRYLEGNDPIPSDFRVRFFDYDKRLNAQN